MSGEVFRPGDRVFYRGAWGNDSPQPGTITSLGTHKGRAVYDVELDSSDAEADYSRWGYAGQFELIEAMA